MIVPNLETNPNPLTIKTQDSSGNEVTLANINLNSAKVLQSATYTEPIITNGPQSISLPYPTYTINFTNDLDLQLPVIDYIGVGTSDGVISNGIVINTSNMTYNNTSSVIYPTVSAGGAIVSLKIFNSTDNPYYEFRYTRTSSGSSNINVPSFSYYHIFSAASGANNYCFLAGYMPDDENRLVLFNILDNNNTEANSSIFSVYKRVALCSIDSS